VENATTPADGHGLEDRWDENAHSTNGLLSVTIGGYDLPSDSRILEATNEFPNEFPYNADMNTGDTIGVGMLSS
jgi:hypothetical protein